MPLEGLEDILRVVKRGSLDRNPRLNRRPTCKKRGREAGRFIEYLKASEFEIGSEERIAVVEPGYYWTLTYREERVTPIYIKMKCVACGCEDKITDPVLTLEYLRRIIKCGEPRVIYA